MKKILMAIVMLCMAGGVYAGCTKEATIDASSPNLQLAKEIVFSAVDAASPYKLAEQEDSNSMDKIADLTLGQLQLTDANILWYGINMQLGKRGLYISENNQNAAETAGDVLALVLAKLDNTPSVTFTKTCVVKIE